MSDKINLFTKFVGQKISVSKSNPRTYQRGRDKPTTIFDYELDNSDSVVKEIKDLALTNNLKTRFKLPNSAFTMILVVNLLNIIVDEDGNITGVNIENER